MTEFKIRSNDQKMEKSKKTTPFVFLSDLDSPSPFPRISRRVGPKERGLWAWVKLHWTEGPVQTLALKQFRVFVWSSKPNGAGKETVHQDNDKAESPGFSLPIYLHFQKTLFVDAQYCMYIHDTGSTASPSEAMLIT